MFADYIKNNKTVCYGRKLCNACPILTACRENIYKTRTTQQFYEAKINLMKKALLKLPAEDIVEALL